MNVEKACHPTEVATDAPAEPVPRAASANQPSVLASLPQGQPSEGPYVNRENAFPIWYGNPGDQQFFEQELLQDPNYAGIPQVGYVPAGWSFAKGLGNVNNPIIPVNVGAR